MQTKKSILRSCISNEIKFVGPVFLTKSLKKKKDFDLFSLYDLAKKVKIYLQFSVYN